jgi:uncharacterized damage-inducible protein DinB
MLHTIKSFTRKWELESGYTLKILSALTNESLAQEVYPGGRTLGRLANHIIETLSELPSKLDLGIEETHSHCTTVEELIQRYKQDSDRLLNAVKEQWTDEKLWEKKNMYGSEWPNGVSLYVLIMHQCHHRGQMTVLMRQAGLKVPGIYGPAKEEWATMGIPAQD